ncbi:NmrA family NAD(P)-binding protein [Kibdelosporangium phytohabitans]|uniref:Hydroxylase n=1 Tax=Kibdelosporangium phytohabitans TaxID=860235 RepID=A0A0N7F4L9_9PSEU|nr:NmrA family NAD(P)-binding protein [Kibdelosporangium phytohabitans]ALG11799.1 hydroxylase [Kibdelosporangium phytohabitans]MBE1463208.1 uncharacterized protein YbjT (DUF2867 family) [Kibdelosporangium phytohabitans]
MTILVTGATGTVGRFLVTQLLAEGHRVRALTRDPAKADLPSGVEVVAGNLADTATLTEVFTGVTAAHLINFDGADGSPLTNGDEIAALAKKAGVARMTVLKGELGHSPLEESLAGAGVEWTALAPGEFMSNALELAPGIRTESVVREPFGDMPSALIHPADIAAVAAVALTAPGHAGKLYMLTGPQALTPVDKVRIIGSVLGRDIRYVELTREEAVQQWRRYGTADETIDFFLDLVDNPVEEARTVQPTVQQVTGKPPRTLAQWVRENAAAFG